MREILQLARTALFNHRANVATAVHSALGVPVWVSVSVGVRLLSPPIICWSLAREPHCACVGMSFELLTT